MSPKFYYFLASFGSNVEVKAREFAAENPDCVFIDFFKILLKHNECENSQQFVSYPCYLDSKSYIETKVEVQTKINSAVTENKSIIVYGSGNNIKYELDVASYLKRLGYKIITYYIKVSLKRQIENVKTQNEKLNNLIFIPETTVIEAHKILKESVHLYKQGCDEFVTF